MSVESIGARIEAINAQFDALLGGTPAPTQLAATTTASGASAAGGGFSQALAGATGGTAAPVSAAGAAGGPGAPTPFAAEIDAAAAKFNVDGALLRALIKQESGFNPNARSPAGATGLTQLMPGTARALGVSNPLDPKQAIEGGAKYLRQMLDRFGGDVRKALAGYNAGPGAVERFGGVPPYAETQAYVRKVMGYAEQYRAQARGAEAGASTAAGPTGGVAARPDAFGIT